jgi:hypothetical protein
MGNRQVGENSGGGNGRIRALPPNQAWRPPPLNLRLFGEGGRADKALLLRQLARQGALAASPPTRPRKRRYNPPSALSTLRACARAAAHSIRPARLPMGLDHSFASAALFAPAGPSHDTKCFSVSQRVMSVPTLLIR